MSSDILSDVLRAVRLRGAMFLALDVREPWSAEAPPGSELMPSILPDAEHVIEFHGVVAGSCWAGIVGQEPVRLEAQDVILFPQGDPHVLASTPGLRPPTTTEERFFGPRPAQLPWLLSLHGTEVTSGRSAGSEGSDGVADGVDRGMIVCGFLGLDARPFNPLLAALPRVLRVSGSTLGADSWVSAFLATAAAESEARRPGGEAVLERMSEMLFVEVLRRHLASLPEGETGWLAGVHDPVVGNVLGRMHDRPGDAWTLESLADAAAVSRSALHERFVALIGQPPMQYLAMWRMQVASGRLRDSGATIAEVAASVGYESEAAFSRAFKRIVGVSPGAWRSTPRPERRTEGR